MDDQTSQPIDDINDQAMATRLEQAERQAAEHLAGWQRALADYQNLKREWERKQGQFMQDAKVKFLLEMLPIVDHLKSALAQPEDPSHYTDWRQGIAHIGTEWEQLLKNWGVEMVPTVGEPFDPHIHEAVEQRGSASDGQSEIVIAEVRPGYKSGERLLFPAQVIIGPPGSSATPTRIADASTP